MLAGANVSQEVDHGWNKLRNSRKSILFRNTGSKYKAKDKIEGDCW